MLCKKTLRLYSEFLSLRSASAIFGLKPKHVWQLRYAAFVVCDGCPIVFKSCST